MRIDYVRCRAKTKKHSRDLIFLDVKGDKRCIQCGGVVELLWVVKGKMDSKTKAKELLERLWRADGIAITREDLVSQALEQAYKAGLEQAADHVANEISTAHLSDEIRKLPSCF